MKTFSSHKRKMKHIIPKYNESSWNTLERSHAEGERKKDEKSLSHRDLRQVGIVLLMIFSAIIKRHHKKFSFIHSYNWKNLLLFHDTLVWTLASFLMICTNHDKDGKETHTHTLRDDMCEMQDNHPLFASSSLLLYVCCKHTQMRTNRKCKRYGKQAYVGLYYFTFIR